MSRPLQWYPLAGADPVPGDPAQVEQAGRRYQEVADVILATARQLESISELSATDSQAVGEVRERAGRTAEEIYKAKSRYESVGSALVEYAAALRAAQESSLEALSSGQSAQRAVDDASMEVTRAQWAVEEALTPEEQTHARWRLRRARNARDDAEVAVSRARTALDEAVAMRDQAAARAMNAIRAVTDADGLNDGWWENWGRSVATAVSHVAGLVAQVAGVLALVLCWVPILGQALAAVALVAGAVALVADVVLLMAGEGSWSDVIWGIVGVASFGVGRAFSVVARASSARVTGLVHKQIRSLTRGSKSGRRQLADRVLDGDRLLPKYRAQGLVDEAAQASPLREALRAYKPSNVAKEIRDGAYAVADRGLRNEMLTQGLDALRAGRSGGVGLGAALRTESPQTIRALSAAPDVAVGLDAVSIGMLYHGAAEAGVNAVRVADVARDQWAGGALVETYRWVTEDTPGERLGL